MRRRTSSGRATSHATGNGTGTGTGSDGKPHSQAQRPHTDPLVAYTAALSTRLTGPARVKSRMVAEIHDGLLDTTDAYVLDGLPRAEAARLAVRDFGAVGELARECQRELTVAQTRHTARAAALCVPFLLVCWALARSAVGSVAAPLALLAVVSTLLAAVTLAATGGVLARRFPGPRALPRVVAWAGTGAGVGMALATAGLVCTAFVTDQWPLPALAGALSAASHAVLSTSVRACRRCLAPEAALSHGGPRSFPS
ncbi:permease prefix domain 1-containing protein [Streptomyces sp. 891-h]|uniref:permease prefix domain 1-containing protein n=1 Tax=Streptomyces sp. 891-h TaxID=2720714 RepID=UPI00242B5428|nr:permease prefix domain 1-containing protein [Streptomyces sp. 891-h]